MAFTSAYRSYESSSPVSSLLASASRSGGAMVGMATAQKINLSVATKFNFSASNPDAAGGLQAGHQAVDRIHEFAADARQMLSGAIDQAKEAGQTGPAANPARGGSFIGSAISGAAIVGGATALGGPVAGAVAGLAVTLNDIMSGPPGHLGEVTFAIPGQGGKSEFNSPITRSSKGENYKDSQGQTWSWEGSPVTPTQNSAAPAAQPQPKLTREQMLAQQLVQTDGVDKLEKQLSGTAKFERDAGNLESAMKNYVEKNDLDKGPAANDPKWRMAVGAPAGPRM